MRPAPEYPHWRSPGCDPMAEADGPPILPGDKFTASIGGTVRTVKAVRFSDFWGWQLQDEDGDYYELQYCRKAPAKVTLIMADLNEAKLDELLRKASSGETLSAANARQLLVDMILAAERRTDA